MDDISGTLSWNFVKFGTNVHLDQLISIWWSKVKSQGHCDFTKNVLAITQEWANVLIMTKLYNRTSDDILYSNGQKSSYCSAKTLFWPLFNTITQGTVGEIMTISSNSTWLADSYNCELVILVPLGIVRPSVEVSKKKNVCVHKMCPVTVLMHILTQAKKPNQLTEGYKTKHLFWTTATWEMLLMAHVISKLLSPNIKCLFFCTCMDSWNLSRGRWASVEMEWFSFGKWVG